MALLMPLCLFSLTDIYCFTLTLAKVFPAKCIIFKEIHGKDTDKYRFLIAKI